MFANLLFDLDLELDYSFFYDIFVFVLDLQTIQQAIGDWYFDKSNVQIIDTQHSCPINCDRTID